MLSKNARQLFDTLPEDGSSISGGNLKWDLEIGAEDFRQAKAELKEAGLVKLGRGRGGSVARIPGAVLPKKALPSSPKERIAQVKPWEAKSAKQRQKDEWAALRARAVEVGKDRHPDADEINPGLYEGNWYVEVWYGKSARTDFFPQELLL